MFFMQQLILVLHMFELRGLLLIILPEQLTQVIDAITEFFIQFHKISFSLLLQFLELELQLRLLLLLVLEQSLELVQCALLLTTVLLPFRPLVRSPSSWTRFCCGSSLLCSAFALVPPDLLMTLLCFTLLIILSEYQIYFQFLLFLPIVLQELGRKCVLKVRKYQRWISISHLFFRLGHIYQQAEFDNKRFIRMGGKSKRDRKKQVEQKRQQRKEQRKKEKQIYKRMKKMGKGDSFKLTRQYVMYYDNFTQELQILGLKLKDVGGDGNCLFRSIADQLDGTEATHLFLREEACKYILNNQEFFSNFIDQEEDGNIYQYVQGMRKDGEWGGHLELQALCECLKCIIIVHKINHQQYYVTPIISEPSGILIHLAYFQHEDFQHYLSIRDMEDNTNDPGMLRLKGLNKNMYQHLLEFEDPEELALMKQIEQMELNDRKFEKYEAEGEEEYYQQEYEKKEEIKEPYPGYPPNKKCKCGTGETYKNCCLKDYHKKMAKKGYY